MKKQLLGTLSLLLLVGSSSAWGQELPPNHPPSGAPPSSAPPLPEGHSETPPPGHPPMHPGAQPVDLSHQDGLFNNPEGKDGQVRVQVLDPQNQPLAGVAVELVSEFESVAQGGHQEVQKQTTNQEGVVVFDNVNPALRYSHQLRAKSEGGDFSTEVFRMKPKGGLLANIHIYPTTSDLKQTLVGTMGFIYVTQREDVLSVEALFRVMNMGKNAWIPKNQVLQLPPGFSGVDLADSGGPGFERHPDGVALKGTFGPGQHDIRFNFQLARDNQAHQSIAMPLPPNMADLRVMTDAIANVELTVPQFPSPELRESPTGKGKVLFTQRRMQPGEAAPERVSIELDGLPTRGPGRWIALLLASAIALLGVVVHFFSRKKSALSEEEIERARLLILQELKVLEEAKAADEVGPKAYRQAHQELLSALARIEDPSSLSDHQSTAPVAEN